MARIRRRGVVTATPAEVAEAYGVAIATVYRWIAQGEIEARRIGRLLLIPRTALQRAEPKNHQVEANA